MNKLFIMCVLLLLICIIDAKYNDKQSQSNPKQPIESDETNDKTKKSSAANLYSNSYHYDPKKNKETKAPTSVVAAGASKNDFWKQRNIQEKYTSIENKFEMLDIITTQSEKEYKDRENSIATLSLYEQAKTKFVFERLIKFNDRTHFGIRTMCEIGFNAGHSAILLLETMPNATLYSFDLGNTTYSDRNSKILSGIYKDRFQYVLGNTTKTLAAAKSRRVVCDVVLADGEVDRRYGMVPTYVCVICCWLGMASCV